MQSGQLRKRITVQKLASAVDDYGGGSATYTDVGVFWASLEPLQGRENLQAQQITAEISHRIRMRAIPNYRLTPRDRLYLATEARYFNIQSVANAKERGFEYEIIAKEIVI